MCLLTFLPAGQTPDLRALHNGALLNSDGHGWAVVADNQLLTGRGLHAATVIDEFAAARAQHPQGPALFHSRYTTHGATDLANCHPFPIGGDERTVLAHNGVLPSAVQPRRGDRRSDTRITAEEFLPRFGSLRSRTNRLRLQRWMTTANKIVVLTVDRRFRQRAYILNEHAGIWHQGIWYSNDGYLPPRQWATGNDADWDEQPCWDSYAVWDEQPEWRKHAGWDTRTRADRGPAMPGWDPGVEESTGRWCRICGVGWLSRDGLCRWCDFCRDCDQIWDACLCFTPARVLDAGRGAHRSPAE